MKLLLSTSNIINGGATVIGRPTTKSSSELTTSLRANFTTSLSNYSTTASPHPSHTEWTTREDSTLYIPTPEPSPGLAEERAAYDITVKLFYLPNVLPERRCAHTKEAISLVLKELCVESIDLLIVAFPNIVFDADDESDEGEDEEGAEEDESDIQDKKSINTNNPAPVFNDEQSTGCNDITGLAEDIPTMLRTWHTLETLHAQKVVYKLGLAEFGTQRLTKFLKGVSVKPGVDQINVRDCCVVPRPLIMFAKAEGIELLTHSDCTNILPKGTLRELLGRVEEGGVGVLAGNGDEKSVRDGAGDMLRGDVEPQWVIKYTAVVRDRGIVENKGYFAVAELKELTEPSEFTSSR